MKKKMLQIWTSTLAELKSSFKHEENQCQVRRKENKKIQFLGFKIYLLGTMSPIF